MKKNILLLLLPLLTIIACETDFEVNADWTETTVVYGLLDQSLDTQKVVIYKAFLGEESAFQMAQQIDSIYYQEDEIIVSLFGIDGEDTLQFINLNYFVNDNREDGIFNNDYTIQYITTEQLDHNLDYHLEIRNVETGNIVKSQTKLISPLEINPGFTDEITFFRNNEYRNFKLKWESSSYARLYKPFLRFYYYEKNIDTGELEFKYIEKSFPQILTINAQAGLDMEISITGESFYYFIKNTLEENTNLLRINAKELEDGLTDYEFWKGGIDFRFLVGGETISQYIEINNLPDVVFQDPPTYTNIENGIGIFSSRLNASMTGKYLDFNSLRHLSNSDLTEDLGFLNP